MKIFNIRWRWMNISQSSILLGGGIVFPFYIIYVNQIGANFTDFGIAYGLFALSSAVTHRYVGELSDKKGRVPFMLAYCWGSAIVFLIFPIVTALWQVYILQILLGILGAMLKTSEKALVADITDSKSTGSEIGAYHGVTSVFAALAVMIGGVLIDLFTLSIIFYIGSAIMFISGIFVLKLKKY